MAPGFGFSTANFQREGATPFLDAFLEDNPDILFQGVRPRTGSFNFQEHFRTRGPQLIDEFLGGVGRQALRGEIPTGSLVDFFTNFDFEKRFASLSPSRRFGGDTTARFNPRTIFESVV